MLSLIFWNQEQYEAEYDNQIKWNTNDQDRGSFHLIWAIFIAQTWKNIHPIPIINLSIVFFYREFHTWWWDIVLWLRSYQTFLYELIFIFLHSTVMNCTETFGG